MQKIIARADVLGRSLHFAKFPSCALLLVEQTAANGGSPPFYSIRAWRSNQALHSPINVANGPLQTLVVSAANGGKHPI